jgi:hypothetical protein
VAHHRCYKEMGKKIGNFTTRKTSIWHPPFRKSA